MAQASGAQIDLKSVDTQFRDKTIIYMMVKAQNATGYAKFCVPFGEKPKAHHLDNERELKAFCRKYKIVYAVVVEELATWLRQEY